MRLGVCQVHFKKLRTTTTFFEKVYIIIVTAQFFFEPPTYQQEFLELLCPIWIHPHNLPWGIAYRRAARPRTESWLLLIFMKRLVALWVCSGLFLAYRGCLNRFVFAFLWTMVFRLLHVCDSMQSISNALQGSSNSTYARWFRSGLRRGLRQLAIRSPLRLLRLWLRGWFDPPKPLTVVALIFYVSSSIWCLVNIYATAFWTIHLLLFSKFSWRS